MRNLLIGSALMTGLGLGFLVPAAHGAEVPAPGSRGVVVDRPLYGAPPPPTPRPNTLIVRPPLGHVWVGGYYEYYRGAYIWRPGYWGNPSYPHYFHHPHHIPSHHGGYMTIQGGGR